MRTIGRRPFVRRGSVEGRAGAIPVLLVAIALVAGCAAPAPSTAPSAPPPGGSPAATTGAPGTSPGQSPGITILPTPSPTAPVTGWTRLGTTALPAVASLTATRAGQTSVAPSTSFRLRSLTDTPVRELAGRLVVTPAIQLAVAKVEGRDAVLRPSAPLRQAQIYRFQLLRADGSTEAAWAVQAAWPLHVVTTLPGDSSSSVPRDTGIEITFNQPGVRLADVRDHVSIAPDVAGRWEQHDQTFVFVPARPLAASTVHTVTIRRGIPLRETGMALGETKVVRFETTGGKVSRTHVTVSKPLFDAAPGERAVIVLNLDTSDETADTVDAVGVTAHRLPGLAAAVGAWRQVAAAPDWTVRSSTTPVRTARLPEVFEGSLKVRHPEDDWRGWVRLPSALPAGWYVVTVTHAGIARQAVLQVSRLSAYASVTTSRSLVWANDVKSNDAVSGASVSISGKGIGHTGANGLLVVRTPRAVLGNAQEESTTIVIVRSGARQVFVPLETGGYCASCQQESNEGWWHLLSLDRARYRVTDTINAWGVVRDRDTGAVPASLTVRLETGSSSYADTGAIATRTVEPDGAGAWTAALPFDDLPPGEYQVRVRAGSTDVAETWLQVGPIAKPAWQIALETPQRAVVTGSDVPVRATASFFEGTSVAGAALRFTPEADGEDDGEGNGSRSVIATTDIAGRAAASVEVRMRPDDAEGDHGQWAIGSVAVRANEPEEGDVSASAPILVFRSTAILDLESTLAGRTMTVTGKVTAVDFARLNADRTTSPWEVDPRGNPLAGETVTIELVERTYVTKQTGTRYDFIAKRVVPEYATTTHTTALPGRSATTAQDGTFRITVTVRGGDRSYSAVATHRDSAGRVITAEAVAGVRRTDEGKSWPSLVRMGTDESWGEYEVGDTVRARFTDGRDDAEVSRYLFTIESRGLRDATVQRSATFRTTFTRDLVPNARITGVRFTGDGYETAGFGADLRLDRRALDVRLSTDAAAYRPGERVTATVETRSAAGTPVAASVFVRAVDEKLFAMGAATVDDPIRDLYQSTGSGRLASGWSHANPMDEGGDGKGDTTGGPGDGREDFRDWLVAELVHTGSDGRASLSFDLSDDLTSWRILASAVTTDLRAGVGELKVPVSLPFFAEVVVAPEYLVADRPSIRVRAYGAALREGQPVRFTVSSGTVPLAAVSVAGTAFEPVEIALPSMPAGTHRVRVTASTTDRTPALSDTLTRTFRVVATRTIRSHVTSEPLADGTTVGGADGLTHVTLADAGRGRVVPMLLETARAEPYRADLAVAAAMARDLLVDGFGMPDDPGLPDPDLLAFQDWSGVSVTPWASPDLELSAIAALSGDPRLNQEALRSYFRDLPDEENGAMPLTRRLYLLLGRAALGDASLGEIALAASQGGLSPMQEVTVALAALAAGDEATAERLYRQILADHGERLGPWVRVKAANADNTAVATARLAIVAAALGDPLAAGMDAEVVAHPPVDTLVALERVIAASWWARTQPRVDAAAAITIDGVRGERAISAGRPVSFDVTPAQRASLRIDPVSGSVVVAARWDGPLAAGDLVTPAGVTITRSVSPAGAIGATDTVVVAYRVTLPANVADGCWQLTDHVPSGLTPVDSAGRYEEAEEEDGPPARFSENPWRVVGQRVDFCVDPDPKRPVHELRYLARVVTSGTYAWEPAVLQSSMVSEHGATVPATEVTIEGIGR